MSDERLRSEHIYDAMVDDEAFAALPSYLARSTGARSCVIHWRDAHNQAEIMAHSAYFSADQMLDYATNFVEHDEWSNGAQQRKFINRAWNTKAVVAPSAYENSVFYNEWIRAMGDDTFHCIGMVMETERGVGMIGLHRGKCQSDFGEGAMKELERHVIDLRRMLTVRARLVTDSNRIRGLSAVLDCNPSPMFAVTAQGKIVHANHAAHTLLEAGAMVRDAGGFLHVVASTGARQLSDAIARAAAAHAPEASVVAIDGPGGHRLEFAVAPVRDRGTGLVLITGRDPDARLRAALQPVGDEDRLAPREIMVAKLVGRGLRNREIAERLGVTEGTVKVYLHNVFAKVGVGTRTELALLVGGMPS